MSDIEYLIHDLDNIVEKERRNILNLIVNIEVVYCVVSERGEDFYNQKDIDYVSKNLNEINLRLDEILTRIEQE
jgi:hypothetical protein